MPFFLFRTGSSFATAGFTSMFAFWMGGRGGAVSGTPVASVAEWLIRARRRLRR